MGVIILTDTTDIPITMAGEMAGTCWGADTSDHEANFKRGLNCIHSGHDRVLEYPQIYMSIDGYSARVIRELYTHIGGMPTRLQQSTRYVDCKNFNYIMPPDIEKNEVARNEYEKCMKKIQQAVYVLEDVCGIKREDAANLLPLGMETKIVYRTNLRNLIEMSHQRMCNRAYWEYRKLMKEIIDALAFYSDEWKYLVEEEKIFVPKCEICKPYLCPEAKGCGKHPKEEEYDG